MPSKFKLSRSTANGLFLAVCIILIVQAAMSRVVTIDERAIPVPGLHQVPMNIAGWQALGEASLGKEVTDYLKPDEYILRDYSNAGKGNSMNLFVAYFKSLQNSYGPHSPRICLPGNGWLVLSSKIDSVKVPQRTEPIPVNEYLMEKSGERIMVLYWYQNDRNIWAEEFQAKLRLLPDLLRYRRADVSLVRLVSPVGSGTSASEASAGKELSTALDFTRLIYPILVERFSRQ